MDLPSKILFHRLTEKQKLEVGLTIIGRIVFLALVNWTIRKELAS